ncbi:MAG: ester cyclase [Flavobacteriaceae bacterium]|nr:ester cyclase [Flavobacteriaceae bacterium]
MKKIVSICVVFFVLSCGPNEKCVTLEQEKFQTEQNLNTYKTAWELFFENRDPSVVNTDSFDENVTVVTSTGDITGIDAFRDYYNNYLKGFSDAEFIFVDIFAQGDKLVKHWNFKGTHDGEMFGIPATNNKVDISGTTMVLMKDGKVFREQDFFDNHSFLMQLGLLN